VRANFAEAGRPAQDCDVIEISREGCRLSGRSLPDKGAQIELRLAGAAPITSEVLWSNDDQAGVAFGSRTLTDNELERVMSTRAAAA
jgi:hypothetical protein